MTDNTQNTNPQVVGVAPAQPMDAGMPQAPVTSPTPVVDPTVGQSVPGTQVPSTDSPMPQPVTTPEPVVPTSGVPTTPDGDAGMPGGGVTPPPAV